MTTKLALELENRTKKGFDEIVKDLERMGVKGRDLDEALEGLNQELESRAAINQAKRLKALADEFDGTAVKARQAAAAQRELAEVRKRAASDDAGNGGNSIVAGLTAISNGAKRAIGVVKELAEMGQKAYQAIAMFSEASPRFAKLKESIDGVGTSAKNAAASFAATDFGGAVLEFASRKFAEVGEGLEALPTLWQDLRVIAISTLETIETGLGVENGLRSQQITAIQKENEAHRQLLELKRQEIALASSNANAAKADEGIKRALDQHKLKIEMENLAERATISGIEKIKAEERAAMEAKQKAGKLSAEDAEKFAARQIALEGIIWSIFARHEEEFRKDAEARKKRDDEWQKAKLDAATKAQEQFAAQSAQRMEHVLDETEHERRAAADLKKDQLKYWKEQLEANKHNGEFRLKILKEIKDAETDLDKTLAKNAVLRMRENAAGLWDAARVERERQRLAEETAQKQIEADSEAQMAKRKQFAAQLEQAEKFKQFTQQSQGGGPGQQLRDQIKANSPAVAQQIIKNREQEALAKWRTEQITHKDKQGNYDRKGQWEGKGDKRRFRLFKGNTKIEENKIRAKARGQFNRDLRQGKVGQAEGEKAVSQLTNNTTQLMTKNKSLNETAVKSIEQLVQAANKQAEEIAALQDRLNSANQALRNGMSRASNSTSRAGRAGGQ